MLIITELYIRECFLENLGCYIRCNSMLTLYMYSGGPNVRPPLLYNKCGLSRGVALIGGRNQYNYVKINIVKWPLQRGCLSSGWPLKRGSTVLF